MYVVPTEGSAKTTDGGGARSEITWSTARSSFYPAQSSIRFGGRDRVEVPRRHVFNCAAARRIGYWVGRHIQLTLRLQGHPISGEDMTIQRYSVNQHPIQTLLT